MAGRAQREAYWSNRFKACTRHAGRDQRPAEPARGERMKPSQLLAFARDRGLILRADGPHLRVRGPRQTVVDLRPEIEANKNELLALLREERHGSTSRTPTQRYSCSRCRGLFVEDELALLMATTVPD